MNPQPNNNLFFKSVFNTTPVALAVIGEDGLFVEVNEGFCGMFGYNASELKGLSSVFIFPESIQKDVTIVQQSVLQNGQAIQQALWQGKTKQGLLIDLAVNFDLFADEQSGRFIVASYSDISDQKRKHEVAESTLIRYRSIVENSVHAFFLTGPDGTILDANKAAEIMFGYTVEELRKVGLQAIIDYADPRVKQKLLKPDSKGFAAGEVTGIRKSGEKFPLEFSSNAFKGMNGEDNTSTFIYDISVRKEQEQKFQQWQEEMASILNNTEEMFMIIDKEYKVVNYNKATKERAKSILGKELNMGDSLLSLAEPERYGYLTTIYNKVLAGEKIRYKHIVDRGFGIENYQLTYSPLLDADGDCSSFMVTVRDITVEEKILDEITHKQELLQQAESIAHVGSWEIDLVTNKLYWSEEVFRICGYEPNAFEVTPEHGFNVVHPEDRASSIAAMRNAVVNKSDFVADNRFVRPDGSIRYIKSKAKVVSDKEGKAVRLIGVFHDVTDQRAMERELAISQQEYRSLFDQNPDAVVSFDLMGNFVSVNDAGMLIAETTREKLLSEKFESYFDEIEVEVIRNYFKEARNGHAQRFQTEILTSTGKKKTVAVSLMPIIIAGEITGVFGILKDVTIEKLYENELEFQSNLLSTIQQSVIVTTVEGAIIYWNNFAEQLYGWQGKEVIGKNIMEVVPAEMSFEQATTLMEKLSAGESWRGEFLVNHKSSGPFKIQVQNSPLRDVNGKLIGIIGISWDITKEVEANEVIKFQANLLDNVEQAVIAADLKGSITYWNHFAEKLYGYTKEEAIGNDFSIIATSDPFYTAQAAEVFQLVAAGKSWSGDFLVRNKQNAEFLAFSINSPVFGTDGNVQGIIGVSYDITEAKKAAHTLKVNEEQLNLIYNSTAGIIFLLGVEGNGEAFHFISMNNAGLSAIGMRQEDLFNKPVQQVIPEPSFSLAFSKYNEAVRSGKPVVWQEEATYPTGVKTGIVTVTPIYDNEGNCVRLVGSVNDITELKETERSLAISRQQYKSLFDQNPDAVYSLDLEGNFTSFNPGTEKLLECTRQDIIEAGSCVPFCHPDDLEKIKQHFLKVKTGEPQTFDVRAITVKGNQKYLNIINIPIVVDGNITGVYGIAKDVTSEQLALFQLELSNERYEYATNATNDVIWDWDIKTNKVVRAGTGFNIMFGYDAQNANSDDLFWMKKVHPADVDIVVEKRKKVFDDVKQDFWEDEYRFLRSNEEYAFVYDRGYIFRDEEGKPLRMIGATKDITEQKLSELRLKELNGQLERRAEQLQISNTELERFAYIASHDLQEPLRMISSFLQLLEKKYHDSIDEKGREYIRFAVEGSLRMKYLINDLLDYSRISTRRQNLEQVHIDLVIKDVLQNLSLRIEEKQAVIKTSALPLLPIADKTQMTQLFQNLLSNALKYSGDKQPHIEINVEEREDEWLFSVKDNGIGFDEKFADKIFVIFQRLHNKSEYSGTGIGLAICKKIIDRHGGRIYADSVPGEGSTFWFTIKRHLISGQ
ncbi:PAS domain S-box protein [Lacibacter sp. H375]|uniref:PAS domain S-box protein n=1 Tax=Lacibacter sp. H375 TaxID=3133424 RepID=UPI0030BE2C29